MTTSQLYLAFRRAQWSIKEPPLTWFPIILLLLSVLRLNALIGPRIGIGFWITETVCLILTVMYCSRLRADMNIQLASVVSLTGLSWAVCSCILFLGFPPKGWAGL